MMKGDGSKSGSNVFRSYTTISRKLKDSFCELILKLGYSPVFREIKPQITYIRGREIKSKLAYTIGVRRISKGTVQKKDIKLISYNGKVWCVRTPLNNFLSERNGKLTFTGNSMTELVKDHGWLCKSLGYDLNLETTPINAETAMPDVYSIADCLKDAYFDDKKRERYGQDSREFSLRYNWDDIVNRDWVPLLNSMIEDMKPKGLEERKLI